MRIDVSTAPLPAPVSPTSVAGAGVTMADRVRTFDWSRTPLGPMEEWPQSLKTAVGICLNSRFPMFVWWGPQLVNLYNDAYAPILGARHPAALGRPAREVWGEIWSVVGPQAEQVMRRGEATWNERVLLVMERHGYSEDTYFTWSYSPIPDEREGIGGVFCACTEETARVVAEADRDRLLERVESERTRLAEAFAQSPGFLAILRGPDHVFEFANEPYLQLIGRRDILNRPVRESLPEVIAQGFVEILDGVYRRGEPYVGQGVTINLRRRPDAAPEPRDLDFVYQPMRDASGAVTGILVHGVDVTDRNRGEREREALLARERAARAEAERASEAKSEFLATLSHELRTPLTPVLLTVSLMEANPELPDSLRGDLATIRQNVELESRLISDLLDLTRIAKGKLRMDSQPVDLHQAVRSAVDICQREASAKLLVKLDATRHTVRGDSTRLQQVFWNLINNAIKFTGQDGTITVTSADLDGGRVRVDVTDTGVGIDAAVLPKLFNAFEQGEVRESHQFAGLGLGLAITRRLVEAHGGAVSAHSGGRGRGATFRVELPAEATTVKVAPSPARPEPNLSPPPLKVLLVEDHEPTLDVLTRLLRRLGHDVTGANSAAGAVAIARRQRFDLVISDLGLPDGSGLDVMRKLRHRYAGRSIALTGYGMDADIAASREAGFAEHLTKPVDLPALQDAIRRVVGGR